VIVGKEVGLAGKLGLWLGNLGSLLGTLGHIDLDPCLLRGVGIRAVLLDSLGHGCRVVRYG
jgi:hypothetical protein